MNSRERILTTLDHREPERVPFDLGACQVTGIHNIQADVPPDNIIAMWEALQEYGVY